MLLRSHGAASAFVAIGKNCVHAYYRYSGAYQPCSATLSAPFSRRVSILSVPSQTVPESPLIARLAGVVAAALAPFDAHKERYGELERRQLATEVSWLGRMSIHEGLRAGSREPSCIQLSPTTSPTTVSPTVSPTTVSPTVSLPQVAALDVGMAGDAEDTVHRMTGAVATVAQRLQLAVERCLAFTAGTEVEALLRALDDAVLALTHALTGTLALMKELFLPNTVRPPPRNVSVTLPLSGRRAATSKADPRRQHD